jgi:hypothetical protein
MGCSVAKESGELNRQGAKTPSFFAPFLAAWGLGGLVFLKANGPRF